MLQFRNISHRYSGKNNVVEALDCVNLKINQGEFVCILGPSGCGKTSLLNMAAGFIKPSEGMVMFKGDEVKAPGRDRAVMFQESALVPWLTVGQNIEIALDAENAVESGESKTRLVNAALETVGLRGFNRAMPHELSGGMKQKAAIARTLVIGSEFLLMDEPFSSLDEQTRLRLNRELVDIWRSRGKTVLFITHSIQEAVVMSTRIVLLSARPGRITGEWVPGDDGLSGKDRQKARLDSENFNRMASDIRGSMDLCCPPEGECRC